MIKRFYKSRAIKPIVLCLSFVIGLSLICFFGITIAHMVVFSRADYNEYATDRFLLYSDLDSEKYPREEIKIPSGNNALTAWIYGAENTQGLIVVSPVHRDANDIKLYEITYFVDAGWRVLCYDYTGCFNSEGNSMIGYTQSVRDIDAVLNFVEMDERLAGLPVMLFGHSLGGYASAAVLSYGHDIKAAIIASALDTPEEQWTYSIERFTGVFHVPLLPFTKLFISMKYGEDADLSAVEGISAVDIPVLVLSGTDDEYYGGVSKIYAKREQIQNPNCTFELMEKPEPHGHYDYFLTDEAIAYQKFIKEDSVEGIIDKNLYMEHRPDLMDMLNEFLLAALK